MATLEVLGIDRDRTQCECCGKTGLKLTVILARLDADGGLVERLWFGRDCAARATRLRRTGAALEALAEEAQRQRVRQERERALLTPHNVNPAFPFVWAIYSVGNN